MEPWPRPSAGGCWLAGAWGLRTAGDRGRGLGQLGGGPELEPTGLSTGLCQSPEEVRGK